MVNIKANEVEYLKVSDLMDDPRNTKEHPDAQVAQIAASIQRFGFNDPVAVDADGVIIEGHGRVLAAKKLGQEEVPCIRLQFASENERRAYGIAHNQCQHLTGMDNKMLASEIDRLAISEEDYQPIGITGDDIVFLGFEESSRGGGGGDNDHARFAAMAVIKSDIRFENEDQLIQWYAMLDWLRERYPDCYTIADRIDQFISDYDGAFDGNR